MDNLAIHVAEYLIELPPRKLLEEKLHRAIESAKERINALPAREADDE